MWKVTLVISLWISIVCSYPKCKKKMTINKLSGCPYREVKSEQFCQIDYTPYNLYYDYFYNVNGTSELILKSSKTNKEIKVKIPTDPFKGHLNGDEFLINGEEKASIDKEDKYFMIMKGHCYYYPDKCVFNPNKEIEECPVTKNGTQYQVDSKDYCQLLKIYKNENVNLTINEVEKKLHFAISYRKGKEFNYFYRHFFETNHFLNFDWSNEVVRSTRFNSKSIPKDIDYFQILSDGKIAFTQTPSREEIISLRGWLFSFQSLFINE